MKSKEEEYKALFLADALQNYEELNQHFVVLEKKHTDKQAINSIFRIVHTLKGNAMGMGYEAIANLTHVMEDLMGEIKENRIELDSDLFASLFRACDKLGELIKALETDEKVGYLGIRTKLEVLLKNRKEDQAPEEEPQEPPESTAEPTPEPEEPAEPAAPAEVRESQPDKITFAEVIQIPVRKMDELKQSVQLAVHEQKDPLLIYKFEAFELFKKMIEQVNKDVISFLFKGELPTEDSNAISEARQPKRREKLETKKEEVLNMDERAAQARAAGNTQRQPQVVETIVRDKPKIGRNERVTIKNVISGENKTLKYKQAEPLIDKGEWVLIEN